MPVLAALVVLAGVVVAAVAPAAGGPEGETPGPSPPAGSVGTYAWPVHGPVIRRFEPPASPYGPGHRGIDIGASPGTPVRAPAGGTVAFAGRVAGQLHLSVDHPDGVRTSYSYLETVAVRAGDAVARGTVLAATGHGHGHGGPAHLHFGARYAGEYIDPMLLLERGSLVGLIRLAPLEGGDGRPP